MRGWLSRRPGGLRGSCVAASPADPRGEGPRVLEKRAREAERGGYPEGFAAARVGTGSELSLSWPDAFLPLLSPRTAFPLAGRQRPGPRSVAGEARGRLPEPARGRRGLVLLLVTHRAMPIPLSPNSGRAAWPPSFCAGRAQLTAPSSQQHRAAHSWSVMKSLSYKAARPLGGRQRRFGSQPLCALAAARSERCATETMGKRVLRPTRCSEAPRLCSGHSADRFFP